MGIAERKEREKQQRREGIIKAAEKVFFSPKGKGNAATMDAVAKKAALSKGTLYLYFKNREDILQAIALKGAMKMATQLELVLSEENASLSRL